ncbi:MAG TPA: periplasmic heavy metal sensor [Candidatus Binataceae bacterium]|nr:periplasmic heavy metal sensor [Candidatus Binataceae bacterium]
MRKLVLVAALAIGTGFVASAAHAQGFHGHHHGGAMGSCMAVMNSTQKGTLKATFSGQKSALQTDRQNVMSARNALTTAILAGNAGSSNVATAEGNLGTAQAQLQKDEDTLAAQVCGQLSSTQLTAAQTLNTNMTNLHASTRQQAQSYFQAAQAAANPAPASVN